MYMYDISLITYKITYFIEQANNWPPPYYKFAGESSESKISFLETIAIVYKVKQF